MTGAEHYRMAELLLESSQMPGPHYAAEAEQYPALEDDVDSVSHALAAAQVHATLALAYSQQHPGHATPPGPCPSTMPPLDPDSGPIACVWQAGHAGLHSRGATTWNDAAASWHDGVAR